jgi:hypothetical protein
MTLQRIWQTVVVNLRLCLARPTGYGALGLLMVWAASVSSIGVNKADFAAAASELGYAPLSDAALAGLGASQVAGMFMTLVGVLLLLNSLDRERDHELDEVFCALPLPTWSMVVLQYVGNTAVLLAFAVVAYLVALVAYPLRGLGPLSLGGFLWPGVLFPLGSALLLAALPLFLDALGLHHIRRGIAYGLVVACLNLGPFALGAATYLDHPLHPLFQVWFTANQGLDTFGIWYLQGYLNLVFQVIEQLGVSHVPSRLFWLTVVRPRLVAAGLGFLLVGFAAWRFDRFRIAPE